MILGMPGALTILILLLHRLFILLLSLGLGDGCPSVPHILSWTEPGSYGIWSRGRREGQESKEMKEREKEEEERI
jgi:hypothetical protein